MKINYKRLVENFDKWGATPIPVPLSVEVTDPKKFGYILPDNTGKDRFVHLVRQESGNVRIRRFQKSERGGELNLGVPYEVPVSDALQETWALPHNNEHIWKTLLALHSFNLQFKQQKD